MDAELKMTIVIEVVMHLMCWANNHVNHFFSMHWIPEPWLYRVGVILIWLNTISSSTMSREFLYHSEITACPI